MSNLLDDLTKTQGFYTSYNEDLSAKVDEYVMSMETWVFEMLAKHNEEVLVPVDDDGNFIVKKKTITIYNVRNHLKADKLDKHRKIKIKFWTSMKMIRGKRYSIRLENGDFAYYSCRMYEGWYNKF